MDNRILHKPEEALIAEAQVQLVALAKRVTRRKLALHFASRRCTISGIDDERREIFDAWSKEEIGIRKSSRVRCSSGDKVKRVFGFTGSRNEAQYNYLLGLKS